MDALKNKKSFSAPEQGIASKLISLEDIYPIMMEMFSEDGSFTLTITGCSMFPTLLGGRDRVTLVKPPERLKKNDLPLYRRKNGQFVLHRIVRVEADGSYTCCGDHQWVLEKGITQEQIVALAVGFKRKKVSFSNTTPHYCRWVRFWTFLLPLRKFIFSTYRFYLRIKGFLCRILRKGKRKRVNA